MGTYEPGRRLNIGEFAEALGVSHTPTREALQLLASEGLVEINDYRGARVAPLSAEEYQEIFLMRVGLEGLASRLGAEHMDDATLERVSAAFAQLEATAEAEDVDAFIEADREFHRLHYLASGREGLWKRVISLRAAAERYTRLGYLLPRVGMKETAVAHRRLLRAVVKRDGAKAEAEIVKDLNRTFQAVHAKLVADEQREAGGSS